MKVSTLYFLFFIFLLGCEITLPFVNPGDADPANPSKRSWYTYSIYENGAGLHEERISIVAHRTTGAGLGKKSLEILFRTVSDWINFEEIEIKIGNQKWTRKYGKDDAFINKKSTPKYDIFFETAIFEVNNELMTAFRKYGKKLTGGGDDVMSIEVIGNGINHVGLFSGNDESDLADFMKRQNSNVTNYSSLND